MNKPHILAIVLCILLLCSSCGSKPEYDFVSANVMLCEPNEAFALIEEMYCVSLGTVSYFFSFVGYIVSQLGEREAISFIFSEGGVDHAEYKALVQGWVSFIKGEYASYSKYK